MSTDVFLLVIATLLSNFPLPLLITGVLKILKRGVPLVEQELQVFLGYPSSTHFSGCHVSQSLVFGLVFC